MATREYYIFTTSDCLDSGDSDIDSSIGGLSNGKEDGIDKEMLQVSQEEMER